MAEPQQQQFDEKLFAEMEETDEAPVVDVRTKYKSLCEDLEGTYDDAPCYRIVLTGGPCAGKTTALARLSNYLKQRGFRVFTVPEAATLLFSNGATFDDLGSKDSEMLFQGYLMQTQIHLENTFYNMAKLIPKPSVLLCDRGVMDGSAYIDDETWAALLKRFEMDEATIRDTRYDAVLHMVTAAIGAAEHYSLETNLTRTESTDEAAVLDNSVRKAWSKHEKQIVIGNETGFEEKLQRVVNHVNQIVGLPVVTTKKVRKYLIEPLSADFTFPVPVQRSEVEKVYLRTTRDPETFYTFVRRRTQGAIHSYGQTTCKFESGERVEVKRIIQAREYSTAVLQRRDPRRHVVKQHRFSFYLEGHFYEIHQFIEPNVKYNLLHVHMRNSSEDGPVPKFFTVVSDVTDDDTYSAYRLSKLAQDENPNLSSVDISDDD